MMPYEIYINDTFFYATRGLRAGIESMNDITKNYNYLGKARADDFQKVVTLSVLNRCREVLQRRADEKLLT